MYFFFSTKGQSPLDYFFSWMFAVAFYNSHDTKDLLLLMEWHNCELVLPEFVYIFTIFIIYCNCYVFWELNFMITTHTDLLHWIDSHWRNILLLIAFDISLLIFLVHSTTEFWQENKKDTTQCAHAKIPPATMYHTSIVAWTKLTKWRNIVNYYDKLQRT